MKGNKVVVGVFTYLDDTLRAIEAAKDAGLEYKVYSPFASHEIEEATIDKQSPIKFITATGALVGLVTGFSLAILMSLDWPLRVSAKEIVAIPGFVVIGYEMTILLGALCTFLAIMHFCKLPDIFKQAGYDPRFTHDKFGVVVGCGKDDIEKIKEALVNSGADEVEVQDAL